MPSDKQKIQSENILYINMDGNITPGIVINVISEREGVEGDFLYNHVQLCIGILKNWTVYSTFNVRVDLLKINICYRV